ncbi:ArsR/SmtB family transcription factor [Entomospira culicis]|uniref:Winged helix-turn-helix transcriptional regulator n=1 Tax=Entomospira culicis TaxID=2719989 RepID=A0A968GFB0_9SPIO|nr:metalloregulator ArsR/SmtB family transcription factor [Entomospira culicis]NIZ19239.1 winged helix-turn-helix transcriptional regulator [Entomospira culicis]NIZ69453.1 winged helix-turn-helix transcriptional regulator [Entomospira culicis]WDI36569.1 metalloregulator ArsR/SmtB family transcription factor [Entomospira culicis]WDI38195.1 metalloregulator ArsR/SmtB family transcription factor [Entomospira culicis]
MHDDYPEQALLMKAFCDESRLAILSKLKVGERCGCALLEELVISQSTLSHHMKILLASGVVQARKAGKWVYYSLDHTGLMRAKQYLNAYTMAAEQITLIEC